jgi:uncharacterized protein
MDELPLLSPEEVRVLGSLIEKSRTTPDYYPMSLNAVTAACNQKSSRHPVVDYAEETALSALNSLKASDLVATAVGGGSRTIKYKHNFNTVFDVPEAALAALCLLFLRGPMTPGEINAGSGRLYEYASTDSITETLNNLVKRHPSMVTLLPRRPGQKEARYAHLFSGPPVITGETEDNQREEKPQPLLSRIESLEREVAELKETITRITKELF